MTLFEYSTPSNYIITTLITLKNKELNKIKLSIKYDISTSNGWDIGRYYWRLLIISGFLTSLLVLSVM